MYQISTTLDEDPGMNLFVYFLLVQTVWVNDDEIMFNTLDGVKLDTYKGEDGIHHLVSKYGTGI